MAWNALVENREGENLTNAIESSDIGNKTLCLQAFCLQKIFVDIINMTYSCRVVLDMICMECGNYEDR